ncbi:MAG: NADH-quinone oxidoreductase subunit M [gamma proteobacterium symbiont of Bathyaustriella thionipta]|nr:NADH-quinone oxidoreductase subunit M [gamma proteobacterium symbiont of Bathyaustriella thionipta]MCU7949551.1 NADH-quinone oxidoreductase subunit M [gamma proteobacterium symbiont of Bathyaustriella thionipta]MCU7953011.1 NADH-quinone oxidoreductase subunit M [gamma proteobacterium symbiont of Bathyaustriella thionipta]MCU7967576.1 NADH-quinone oxidoreductase subunit M [gamma proteobacterium symbiont of Bathyaustriella thionipta]
MHSLTLLLLLPVVGALIISILPSQSALIRKTAILTAVLTLIYAASFILGFDTTNSSLQFSKVVPWNTRLGTSFALGIDGISFPMVLLATLLSFIAIIASRSISEHTKGYYLLMLLLEAAMLGVFMAHDWSLFYVFWELTLIPLFFLIDRWGGKRRSMASLNFVLYTMGGSVFMLLSLLVLFDATPGHSFAMDAMLEGARALPKETQVLIFLGFLVGFGVKMPIFPIHGWLPLAHVEAPSPVSILLSGILLKMGAYGLIRTAFMLPEAVLSLQTFLMVLALFSLIYGGLLAWRQSDLKGMIAYSSISHMGVVLLGIAALNMAGISGALMQMVAHGLVAGALFLLIGLLYERTHTREITDYRSLAKITPRFAVFTSLAFIAAVGMPGTAGFIAELHVIIGAFAQWGWTVLLVSIGVMISAAYAARTMGRLFTGPAYSGSDSSSSPSNMNNISDLQPVELFAASILVFGFIYLGLSPGFALDLIHASASHFSQLFVALK